MAEFMTHRRAVKGLSGYVDCDICQFVIAGLRDMVRYSHKESISYVSMIPFNRIWMLSGSSILVCSSYQRQ